MILRTFGRFQIDVPTTEFDSRCDLEHYVINRIRQIIDDAENNDEIFEKLTLELAPATQPQEGEAT